MCGDERMKSHCAKVERREGKDAGWLLRWKDETLAEPKLHSTRPALRLLLGPPLSQMDWRNIYNNLWAKYLVAGNLLPENDEKALTQGERDLEYALRSCRGEGVRRFHGGVDAGEIIGVPLGEDVAPAAGFLHMGEIFSNIGVVGVEL